ncbi:hypothetical protein pb186bvf_010179 [Paramecium bursaria]
MAIAIPNNKKKFIIFMRFYIIIYFVLIKAFEQETQQIITNNVAEYKLVRCESSNQCEACKYTQLNEIKICQLNGQVEKVYCTYQLGDDETIQYKQISYQVCYENHLFQMMPMIFSLIFMSLCLYALSKERENIQSQALMKILN